MKLLTWNISGEDLPANLPWGLDLETKWDLIRQILVDKSPDIVAVQEIPMVELIHVYAHQLNLIPVQAIKTHAGITAICIPDAWKEDIVNIIKTESIIGCKIQRGKDVWAVGAMHLMPTKGMGQIRQMQLKNFIDLVGDRIDHIILMGDSNMRIKETAIFEELFIDDAFKLVGNPKHANWTWNSKENPYHENGFGFTARFDKILLRGFQVDHFELIGNQPLEESKEPSYLSDHYGIYAEIH